MRRFPLLLTYIKMVVARRASPIYARGRLARDKTSILPEILARAGAPPTMQAVNHRCRDTPRFQKQPRHAGGKRAAFAGCASRGRHILIAVLRQARICRRGPRRHSLYPIRALSRPITASMVSPSARAVKVK